MKKATYIIVILIGIIAIAIFKQIAKKEIRENTINSAQEERKPSSTENNIEEDISKQNWFINTQFGLAFETPRKITETNFDLPIGTEDYIQKVYSYTFTDKDIGISYMVMESNFTKYDCKEGLRGSVSNFINFSNGTNLEIDFYEIENEYNDIGCEGTCLYKNLTMKVHGYCLFNENGRIYMLIASGADTENTNKKIKRVFDNIKIINL